MWYTQGDVGLFGGGETKLGITYKSMLKRSSKWIPPDPFRQERKEEEKFGFKKKRRLSAKSQDRSVKNFFNNGQRDGMDQWKFSPVLFLDRLPRSRFHNRVFPWIYLGKTESSS